MSQDIENGNVQVDGALLEFVDQTIDSRISRTAERMAGQIERNLSQRSPQSPLSNRATIVAFSADMDKLMAAFIIAAGAAAMGMDVSMYFTFWGLAALKKKTALKGKTLTDKLIALMLPSGPSRVGTSKLNMLGMGPAFFKRVMAKKNVQRLPELIDLTRQSGVRMVACQMAMDVMGIRQDELIDGVESGGVATYLADARDSRITLFI